MPWSEFSNVIKPLFYWWEMWIVVAVPQKSEQARVCVVTVEISFQVVSKCFQVFLLIGFHWTASFPVCLFHGFCFLIFNFTGLSKVKNGIKCHIIKYTRPTNSLWLYILLFVYCAHAHRVRAPTDLFYEPNYRACGFIVKIPTFGTNIIIGITSRMLNFLGILASVSSIKSFLHVSLCTYCCSPCQRAYKRAFEADLFNSYTYVYINV